MDGEILARLGNGTSGRGGHAAVLRHGGLPLSAIRRKGRESIPGAPRDLFREDSRHRSADRTCERNRAGFRRTDGRCRHADAIRHPIPLPERDLRNRASTDRICGGFGPCQEYLQFRVEAPSQSGASLATGCERRGSGGSGPPRRLAGTESNRALPGMASPRGGVGPHF